MPRPKTVSDADVMSAAVGVLGERGMAEFTLADVARKVGLSRAALIQRFGDRDAILLAIARQEVEATRAYLDSLAFEPGPAGLWHFLAEIIASMGNGEGFSVRVALAALEARDPMLKALADQRYGMVQAAIAARLPDRDDRLEIARHLHAVIAGATMQWVASTDDDLAAFVLERTAWAFDRLFAGHRT
jgi:TetR/AcrR family macrolide resistance operon transcriptional repressor